MKQTSPPSSERVQDLTHALYAFLRKQQRHYRQLYEQRVIAGDPEGAQFYRGLCHGLGEAIGELYRLKKELYGDDAVAPEEGVTYG